EAVDVAQLQEEVALEVGEEVGEVRVCAGLAPRLLRKGGGARDLRAQLDRYAHGLLVVAPRDAYQRRLVGVVVELLAEGLDLVEQPPQLRRGQLLVLHADERGEVLRARLR